MPLHRSPYDLSYWHQLLNNQWLENTPFAIVRSARNRSELGSRNDSVTNAKRVQVPSCSSSNALECCGALPPHRVSSGSSSRRLVARCGLFRSPRSSCALVRCEIEDASTSLTSGPARYSKHFRSFASSTGSATYWSMWPTATGLSKAARRTASALFRS